MSIGTPAASTSNLAYLREIRQEIEEFNVEYCRTLDEGRVEDWPKFFTEDAFYRVTGRENFDNGYPLGVMSCDGIGMFKDRAYAITKTLVFGPRYLRHYVSNTRIIAVNADGTIESEANYLVLQTQHEERTIIFQAGRYRDMFVRARLGGELLLRERHCVYDSTLIDTDLVIPI